jgi:hypothetical protein
MEKITVQQAKALIDNSVGSIYSKNDVLAILNRIDEPTQHSTAFEISDEMRDNLIDDIVKDIVSSIENVECVDGWDLSMSYNEVTVDSLEVNESDVEDIVGKWVKQWVNDVNGVDSDCGC